MKKVKSKVGGGKATANKKAASHAANTKKVASHAAIDQENTVQVMVFENPEFGRVRTMIDKNGEPLFCGKDVCDALGYRQPHVAVHQHVNQHDVTKHHVGLTVGKKKDGSPIVQQRQILFVTESGLYSLIFGSKLESAQRFKLWVTSVVLPQIRKTGGYIPVIEGESEEETCKRTEEILRKTLKEKEELIAMQKNLLQEKNDIIAEKDNALYEQERVVGGLKRKVGKLQPKADYTELVLTSDDCVTTTQVAKELGCTAQELNRSLCALKVQYYQSGQYMLYADYAHMGLAKSRTHVKTDRLGNVHVRVFLVWTEKGRQFIHKLAERMWDLAVFDRLRVKFNVKFTRNK